MDLLIQPCKVSELEILRNISYETYDETFRSMNAVETMDAYLEAAFNREKMQDELSNPNSQFFLLYANGDLAGYIKMNVAPGQSDINDPESLEVERIYIRKAFKGQGLGSYLIDFAIQSAAELGKRYVWLGVWEKNTPARAFYEKMGFIESGLHHFRMGEELQTDLLMKKWLVDPAESAGLS